MSKLKAKLLCMAGVSPGEGTGSTMSDDDEDQADSEINLFDESLDGCRVHGFRPELAWRRAFCGDRCVLSSTVLLPQLSSGIFLERQMYVGGYLSSGYIDRGVPKT